MKMAAPRFHEVFSPTIMETTISNKFLSIINRCSDEVLSDKKKSIKWDWSHKLVGKVHKEIQIPISNEDDIVYTKNIMKSACISYVEELIKNNTAYGWKKIAGDAKPTIQNIHLTQSWVVSQYAGDFNPFHHHNGDFSAGVYLKVPDGMNDEWKEDFKDHYPAWGLIEYAFGESQTFRCDNIKFKPEVGKFLVFPSWLKHLVYPFTVEGERRMMSFNATVVDK